MPITYEPIATTTLSSAQSSVTFSSISGSYTDLVLVFSDVKLSSGTTFKTVLANSRVQPGSANYSGVETIINLWRSTSAINTIKIMPNVNSFISGSTFTLYGIKAA